MNQANSTPIWLQLPYPQVRDLNSPAVLIPEAIDVLGRPSPDIGTSSPVKAATEICWRAYEETRAAEQKCVQAVRFLDQLEASSVEALREGIREIFIVGTAKLNRDCAEAAHSLKQYSQEIDELHEQCSVILVAVAACLERIRLATERLQYCADLLGGLPMLFHHFSWNNCPPQTLLDERNIMRSSVTDDAAGHQALANWKNEVAQWQRQLDEIEINMQRWQHLRAQRIFAEQALSRRITTTKIGRLLSFGRGPQRSLIARVFVLDGGVPLSAKFGSKRSTSPIPSQLQNPEGGLTRLSIRQLRNELVAHETSFSFRDLAARQLLVKVGEDPLIAYRVLGLSNEMTFTEFCTQIQGLTESLAAAKSIAAQLPGKPEVLLADFDVRDGALVAAISFGNPDEASRIAINVPGMGSQVGEMTASLRGGAELFREATMAQTPSQTYAVVNWFGYRAPEMPLSVEVLGEQRAHAGGVALAAFVNDLGHVSKQLPKQGAGIVVFAHSYGSTVAVEALKMTSIQIESLVLYGSAGVTSHTVRADIHAEQVYAIQGPGDQTAGIGVLLSDRIDPRNIPGFIELSAEAAESGGSPSGRQTDRSHTVTAHDMYTDDSGPSALNWFGKTGYLTRGSAALHQMAMVLRGI